MNLIKRQEKILSYIEENNGVSRKEIQNFINNFYEASRITVLRDIEVLTKNNQIKAIGKARSTRYYAIAEINIFKKYDSAEYFSKETDERIIKYPTFNFKIFDYIKDIFSEQEMNELNLANRTYLNKINNLSGTMLKKEFERLLIELSWKSSQIEGNTYSLLDTETLIKNNIEAEGHNKEEAIMILNHKKALEYIFESKNYYKEISIKKIEELHEILTSNMGVAKGLRQNAVGITGTNYKPLDNVHQIREAMEKLVDTINNTKNPIEKALIAVLLISYIQPFEDGNKRTGRIFANAILYANNYCPLSYRSVKDSEYKKAVILFYENNSLEYFKQIFSEQFKFAVEKYF